MLFTRFGDILYGYLSVVVHTKVQVSVCVTCLKTLQIFRETKSNRKKKWKTESKSLEYIQPPFPSVWYNISIPQSLKKPPECAEFVNSCSCLDIVYPLINVCVHCPCFSVLTSVTQSPEWEQGDFSEEGGALLLSEGMKSRASSETVWLVTQFHTTYITLQDIFLIRFLLSTCMKAQTLLSSINHKNKYVASVYVL